MAIGVLIFFSIRSCISKAQQDDEIKANMSVAIGKIERVNKNSGFRNYSLHYSYQVGKLSYQSNRSAGEACCKGFTDQPFPIVYSKKNPAVSRLLIEPDDFEKFNMVFPDSLQPIYESNRLKLSDFKKLF